MPVAQLPTEAEGPSSSGSLPAGRGASLSLRGVLPAELPLSVQFFLFSKDTSHIGSGSP